MTQSLFDDIRDPVQPLSPTEKATDKFIPGGHKEYVKNYGRKAASMSDILVGGGASDMVKSSGVAAKKAALKKALDINIQTIIQQAAARRAAATNAFNEQVRKIIQEAAGRKAAAEKKYRKAIESLQK